VALSLLTELYLIRNNGTWVAIHRVELVTNCAGWAGAIWEAGKIYHMTDPTQGVINTADTVKAVGAVVWWSVPKSFEVDRSRFSVEAAMAGVNSVPKLTTGGALSRLVRREAKQRSGGSTVSTKNRHLARPVRTGRNATYSLVKEDVTNRGIAHDDHLDHNEVASAGINAEGVVVVKGMSFTADDVDGKTSVMGDVEARRYLLQCAKRAAGITLRDMGGCYFVPAGKLDRFQAQTAVAENHGAKVFVIRVPDLAEEREQLADIISDQYREEMQEIIDAMGDPKTGKRKLKTLADRAKILADDVNAHAVALRMEFGALMEDLGRVEQEASARAA